MTGRKWKQEAGDWTRFRKLAGVVEIDLHRSGQDYEGHYSDMMAGLSGEVLDVLRTAQETGKEYVLFVHGWSTSEGWKQTTARSVVRGVMRSPASTPYLRRRDCVQHYSVFLAAIRPRQSMK